MRASDLHAGRSVRRLAAAAALAFGFALPAFAAPPSHAARVAPAVAERAARGEAVEVMILFDDAREERQLSAALGPASARSRLARAEYEGFVAARAQLMGTLKNEVLSATADPDVEVLTDYSVLPVVHARVRSARALEALKRQGRVRSIDPIVALRPTLPQSLEIINAPAVQGAGHLGAGTTVAVLDTGTDYTRAAFGSCSSPGGACKVAAAIDFATQDNLLDTNGHGTNVAGIVLGVAPGARIAALDVFESNGLAYSNVIVNAINWSITNRAAYNIVAINMSLGGGRHYSPLAPTDSWGSAITNAINAGIVVVAASGNDGYTNSISAPAAYSNVVSVGAVYDSAQGPRGWAGCTDTTTAAWQVTCFSNSASFLTMVAPGAMITAAGITQGGTSQAAPHVAGAVALIKGSYPGETPAQVIDRLKLGANVTDARNGITKPGLDLAASLSVPPATFPLAVARTGSGSGTVVGGPIDCGASCSAAVSNGDSVMLTALHGAGSTFAGWTGACAGSATQCTVSMTAARNVTATFNTNSSEDFLPAGAVPPGWTQGVGSNAAWAPSTASAFVGGASLRAGVVTHGQVSVITVTEHFAAGAVSFARRVSSEAGKDLLRFYIDGVLQGSWSGEVGWGQVAFPVNAGTHVLTWEYVKDGSGSAGSDTAWIDSVHLPRAATSAAEARHDFNADGRADLLWVHTGTGQVSLWLMDGPLRLNGSGTAGTLADLNWQAIGTGDFDGDGQADALWRHVANGSNAIWLMDGIARKAGSGATQSVTDLAWQVAGIGDFDGDGKSDILWRHGGNGSNSIWFMDGTARLPSTGPTVATADPNWRVVAVADFDGNGKADIFWRNGVSGANAVWLMDGRDRAASATLPTTADLAWRVVAAGDFDGDGKADLLWRHVGNGSNALWFMNGTSRTSSASVSAVTDLAWKVAGVGDFNADGKADIAWRNTATGANSVWLMDGATRLPGGGAIPSAADSRWRVAAPRANPH